MSKSLDFIANTKVSLNGAELKEFSELRKEAMSSLEELSIPSTKEEYWKYTRLGKLSKKNYSSNGKLAEPKDRPALSENRIAINNNEWTSPIVDEPKFKVLPIEKAADIKKAASLIGQLSQEKEHFFDAMNSANFNHGVIVWVAENYDAGEWEIEELFSSVGSAYQQRYMIYLEKGSSLSIVHNQQSLGANEFINSLSELYLAEESALDLYLLQEIESSSSLIQSTYARQEANSDFRVMTLSLEGELIRNNLTIRVVGEACETYLNGLSLGRGSEHVDHHTIVDHLVPNCNSYENYKGIFYEKATGVFNGKVFVRPDAQKTNAFQSNQNIVMSDDAKVYSKPELEIYADDVKCSHGSTTGQFDEEALFYLQSRGIGLLKAKTMLVHAFLAELIEHIKIEALREYVEARVEAKLLK